MKWTQTLPLVLLVGCAGLERDCAGCSAQEFGADWIVVQYNFGGAPLACWQLKNVGVKNEPASDGIFWKGGSGHLVHISGWYNRVQVSHGDWAGAAKELDVDLARCPGGKYLAP